MDFVSSVIASMENGRTVDALYLDFSRAFDSLNHNLLVEKIRKYGIPNDSLRWLSSYLSDRSLQVRVNDVLSTAFTATSGVPQGSHLGTVLFLIYVQDLTVALNVNHSMYADDLKLSWEIDGSSDHRILQHCYNQVAHWGNMNNLKLNPTKCQVITFSRRRNHISHHVHHLGDLALPRVTEVKDLGVFLDEQLNFRRHYDRTIAKARITLGRPEQFEAEPC